MPGLLIHGTVISQLLSIAQDNDQRFLIWWFPWWGEILWIATWAIVTGIVTVYLPKLLWKKVSLVFILVTLYLLSYLIFRVGGWTPLIPGMLAVILSGSSSIYLTKEK